MRLVLLIVLLLAASPAYAQEECNCMWYAYEALKRIGVRLRVVPNVIVTDERRHGFYDGKGKVGVPDNTNCKEMIHEFVHHYQRERYGPAKPEEYYLDEMEADEKTVRARNLMGACK